MQGVSLSQSRVATLQVADSKMAMLGIYAKDLTTDPNEPNKYRAIQIAPTSSGGSKLIVLVSIGPSSSDYTQYQFSAYATGISDPLAVDGSPTHTQCTTLAALIEGLNALPGIKAYRKHAPSDYSLDTDDFITLAKSEIPTVLTDYLYPDISEISVAHMRIGIPEFMDAGRIGLLFVRCNVNLNTSCSITIKTDPDELVTTNQQTLFKRALNASTEDAVPVEVYDFHESPPVYRGPLLVTLTNGAAWDDALSELTVQYVPVP